MIPITGLWASILYILFARNALANNGDSSERPPDAPFDWLKLEPSRKLNYVPCSTDLQFRCARLEVPLDWLNVTDKRTVAIAVRTLPAKVPFDHPTFSGSIIVNPGGPGASGTQFIESIGREIQEWFDKPGTRHYEIVSFDPRGVAPTTLTAYCFKNDKQRTHWQLAHQGVGGPLSGVHGPLDADKMGQALAAQDAYMRQCRDAEGELGQSMAHISTANVARDMLDLVDGIDELRRHSLNDSSEDSRDRTQINSKGRLPRLKYLGFSYGAFLGLTYASMFPGRVSRMILDGVVDPNDLVAERGMMRNTRDMEYLVGIFFMECVKQTLAVCPFLHDSMYAWDAWISLKGWLRVLDREPMVLDAPNGNKVLLTGDDARQVIGSAMYRAQEYPEFAQHLYSAMTGNKTTALRWATELRKPGTHDPSENSTEQQAIAEELKRREAATAIICSDSADVTGKNTKWWLKYAKAQEKASMIFGRFWASNRLACASWPWKANMRFSGPFTTPDPNRDGVPRMPEAPIMFLSTRLDPITPLRNLYKLKDKYPKSQIVIQEGFGHTATFSGDSPCVKSYAAQFMEDGIRPNWMRRCRARCEAWDVDCVEDPRNATVWQKARPWSGRYLFL